MTERLRLAEGLVVFIVVAIILYALPAKAESVFKNLKNRMTFINWEGYGKTSQYLMGYWWLIKEKGAFEEGPEDKRLAKISVLENRRWVVVHTGNNPKVFPNLQPDQRNLQTDDFSGVFALYKDSGKCYLGLSATQERPNADGTQECPQYFWWNISYLCIGKDFFDSGNSIVKGYEVNEEDCTLDKNSPLELKTKWERFIGASFMPVLGEKYIYIGAAAVPAQYKVSVKLAWDYSEVAAKHGNNISVVVRLGERSVGRKYEIFKTKAIADTYQFVGTQPGMHQFVFDVLDSKGKVVHTDCLLAELPGIKGINR